MIDENYINKLNDEINSNILNDSLFKSRRDTGDTADAVNSSESTFSNDVLIKLLPSHMDRIGGGNDIVDKAVEKALEDTSDLLFETLLSNIDKTLK